VASWLGNLIKPLRGNGAPALSLGAFGKHPGWDDHIDDFGLDTEALLAAKQFIYVQGVGGVIDSGAWDKLGPDDVLPEFGHVCLWFSEPDMLVARLWSSRDRKGRARYPMVICAHAANLNPHAALKVILPALERGESDCKQTSTAEGVHSILEALRQNLRTQLLSPTSPANGPDGASPPSTIADDLKLTPENDAWQRIFYTAEGQLSAYASGKIPEAAKHITMKLQTIQAIPQHLRLPTDETRLAEVALFWRDLFAHVLKTSAPMLFIQPQGRPWIDLIVGSPGVKQLFCLKASAKAIPPVQEVPYNLPSGFREKAATALRDFCAGR
jgi:hypothetical protein